MDRKEFEDLSPKEQQEAFRKSPLKDRGDLLEYSHDPTALVQSVSQEEFYLMTREMDLDEKKELIKHAHTAQLFFIADVDCWNRDQIDPLNFVRWLETLVEAGEHKLSHWLTTTDYETLVAGLQKVMHVLKPDREWAADEALGDLPYFTLDQYYYIYVREENLEMVKRVVKVIYENYRGQYAAILEGIMNDLSDELEEEAYRRRAIRLAERGFPEAEEANRIYRLIKDEEFNHFLPKNNTRSDDLGEEAEKAPHYPVIWDSDKCYLDDVMLLFKNEPEVLSGLQEEIAWLSNKVIACDGLDFSSEVKVRKGVRRAKLMVSMGLELLAGGDLEKAKTVAREKWLENIFRWMVTKLYSLKEEAHLIVQKYWEGSKVDCLEFLSFPYDRIFQGALLNFPQYCELKEKDNALRDFESTEEMSQVAKSLVQVERIHSIFVEKFKINLKEIFKKRERIVSLYSVLGTLLVLFTQGNKKQFRNLSSQEMDAFFKDAFEGGKINPSIKADFIDHLSESKEDQALLMPLLANVFDDLSLLKKKIEEGKINKEIISSLVVDSPKHEKENS